MYNKTKDIVLHELEAILSSINEDDIKIIINEILGADNVFFVGVGRVLLSLQAIAKRLAHLGIKTHIVGEITEPAIKPGDILIAASGSGESLFPKEIAKKAKHYGAKVIMIGSNKESSLAKISDFMLRVPTNTKLKFPDEIKSEQIMTSLFEQFLLIFGDILAKMIVEQNNINMDSLWEFHANLE